MQTILEQCVEFLKSLVTYDNIIISIIMGLLIVILESIVPILPLAVFIAINMLVMGNLLGFIVSWVGTLLGCTLSFYIFRKGFSKKLYSKIDDMDKIKKFMRQITNIKFTTLVLITALPFTPAFSVNIAAGLSKISYKKFILAMIIAKISIIYFWGYIGTTLIESITDISVLIKIFIMLIIAYIISHFVNKKYNLD